jgi:RNA polymerase sigma factor (sigma-70 family)
MRRLSRLSDEQLSRRLAAGEAAAFDELYRRYVHRLAVYGRQLLGDGAGGEDVAQVALLNAYQAFRKGVVVTRVRPWLYRIARNAALDMLSRRRELLIVGVPAREGTLEPDESDRGLLIEALRRLPKRQCQAWILREVNGLKIAEIAARLELRPEQVEQSLFAARNSLAEEIAFGERLDCESVRRLGQGPLARSERRALRRHLRTCPDCRSSVSLGGGLGALVPLPLLGFVRQLAGVFEGAGAPVAKAGAVLAAAAAASTVPLAADVIGGHDPVPPAKAVPHRAHSTPPRSAKADDVRPPVVEMRKLVLARAAPARVTEVRREPGVRDAERSSVPDEVESPTSVESPDPADDSDVAEQPAESSSTSEEVESPVSAESSDSGDSSGGGESSDVVEQPSEPEAPASDDVTPAESDSIPASSEDAGDGSSSETGTSQDSSD